jgi:hypothetical protein
MVRRFQVEALEVRLAPGAGGSGVIGSALTTRGIGEEIPQVAQVVTYGSSGIRPCHEGNAHDAGVLSPVQKVRE